MAPTPAVVILGAGLLQVPLIQMAQEVGLRVIALDQDRAAPGKDAADQFYAIDPANIASLSAVLMGLQGAAHHIVGVCTAGADLAWPVAVAAALLRTPGLDSIVAHGVADKAWVRACLAMDGETDQYQPKWVVTAHQSLDTDLTDAFGYPCVFKPRNQRASRGVTLVNDSTGVPAAIRRLAAYVRPEEAVVIEARKHGVEFSVECVLDGQGHALCWNESQRYFCYTNGVPIELGHINPPPVSPALLDALHAVVLATAWACGVTWGPWKNDLLVDTDAHVWVLECCARLSGGWDCQRTQPIARGMSLMRPLVKLVCGMPLAADEVTPSRTSGAACHAVFLPPGRVRALPARDDPSVVWHVKSGDVIPRSLGHNAQRAGFVFTEGPVNAAWLAAQDRAEALAADAVMERECGA